ncbi:helix-turn-helix transcriptional regulator [Phenylobacterium sp. SCN 70-31]|uniref:helix-turn-helix domain-containing protein n=1 Tax=Phenylobacterium sp. SCN 70-31 TaxID=1660129 RepID=UPI0025FF7516|nr:helix-turn-helix transcriptional regulator [Phenylobacterium sp. SCN 70-31]
MPNDAASGLSPRQIECLRLAAAGKTSIEIAATLGLSSRTVDQYVGEACERLKVRNRVQAVAKAVSLGLLSDSPP